MTRLNITLPDEIANRLAGKHNKSRFIAEALKAKLDQEIRERLEGLMFEGYKAESHEDKKVNGGWEKVGLEKWD